MRCGGDKFRRLFVYIFVFFAHFSSLTAAEFKTLPSRGELPALIIARGELAYGDEQKFVDVALSLPDAVVVLDSPGGNLHAGIEIGKAIKLKGYMTFVPARTSCASACALAWLGGRTRVMSKDARVGFHAAFNKDDFQVNSSANALIGAYLNQLGLPTAAVLYITTPQPNEIQWLSFSDAQKVGIDVKPLEIEGSVATTEGPSRAPTVALPSTPRAPSVTRDRTAEARRFVEGYWSKLNDPSVDLSTLSNLFAPEVDYYGASRSRADVAKEKADFFARWPERRYAIDPGSLSVTCDSGACRASGIVTWEMTSSTRGRQSTGAADFNLSVSWQSGAPAISQEMLAIKSRKVAAMTTPTETAPPTPQKPADRYRVEEVYQGASVYPDFKGRDRSFSNYRSRIRDGVANGANFAGRYSLIQIGCGTGCSFVLVTDVSTGQIFSFPRGGEANMYLRLKFDLRSSLLLTRWFGSNERCIEEAFEWRDGVFRTVRKRDIGDEDACHVPGLFEDEDWKF